MGKKFKYKDQVKIRTGFYENEIGFIISKKYEYNTAGVSIFYDVGLDDTIVKCGEGNLEFIKHK